MMRTLYSLLVCISILSTVALGSANRGFILTAPKSIDAGSTEYLTFTAFNVSGGQVTIKILNWYTQEVLAESKGVVINNMNMWVEIVVPPLSTDTKAKLQLKGTFSDGYKIEAEKEVFIRHSTIITFVQTDKPIYKPGQTVKFRVLPLDSQLKPLEANAVADVWIEDPSDIRVVQWKQIKFDEGMVQLELPLSNEPTLGTWSIKTIINKVTSTQKFDVEKYVLPKFEVKVKPPSFAMADAVVIPVEICAWYTYGKKVDGTYEMKANYKRNPWESRHVPTVKYSGLISGCEIIDIYAVDFLVQSRRLGIRNIEVFVRVTENGTGIVGNSSATLDVSHSALSLTFLGLEGDSDYFKPGLPYFGQLSVTKPDGVPVANEKIEICAEYHESPSNVYLRSAPREKFCHLFTSDQEGVIPFSVAPAPSDYLQINIVAEAVDYETIRSHDIYQPTTTLNLHPWYSKSGSYLQIETMAQEMKCERRQGVKIRYTAEKGSSIKFYHQVLSRGRIVQQGSHQRAFYSKDQDPVRYDLKVPGMSQRHLANASSNSSSQKEVGEFLLSFDPRATMAPLARLLVFYVREDGEIVADARMFRIAHCLLNKVNLQFRHEQQYPSTEASMLLTASPSSLCGVGLVDKSVRLLRKKEQFSRRNIFEALEKYDVNKENHPRQVTEDYCLLKNTETRMDSISLDYITPYSRHYSDHVDTSMAFEEAGMVVITNFELENRPCVISQPAVAYWNRMDLIMPRREFGGERSYDLSSIKAMREEEPPKPIEAKKPAEAKKPTEAEEIRNYFPETWLWEMHPIGSSGQVVIKRKLPHTITQWVGGAVCVHHKTGLGLWEETSVTAFQPFFVSFTLPYSVVRGEVLPLTVSVFNYLSECLPIKLSLETSEEYRIVSDNRWHKMCVCGGESRSHRFSIEPTALGKVNITVYGFSLEEDDGDACGNEVTARLSARDAVSKQLLVEAEGFPKEEVFNYFVCPENTNGTYATEVDLLLPEDVVDGSGRAYVSVTGDLMGPALSGLSGLVRLPMGCGEQNMILFTPNIFVLDYLTSTGRITDEIKDNCLKNMKIGYQRELTYRHKDGSYSAFGSSDPEGSLWLTAFVVRSFGQARKFIDIDAQDLSHSTSWILQRQFENGCFEPSGKVIHKAMKGGLTDGEHSLAPLTAYVLISLLESWIVHIDQPAMRTALKCLETEENPSSYSLSLFAYASSLANEKRAAYLYLKQLEDRAIIKDGLMYWDTSAQNGGSKSVSIEIAGYYIMSRVNLDGRDSTGPVMSVIRWITQQRNSQGGFVSTQDTVVALQALAKYSALQAASATDIGLVVESDELVKGFKVDEDNKLVTQTAQIPVLPAVVDLQAVGDGCTLVQFSMRYNVEKGFGSDAFDLDIKTVRLGSSKCNLPRLDICMRYKIPNQKTNMVVVSVKMPSGYIPDGWSLFELHSNTAVQLKRHELDGNQVNLYFNELTNEAKCFMFFIKSEAEVEDIKPSSVKLYDYYQPELEITKEYTIPMTCTMIPLPDILDELDELPETTIQPDGKEEPPITIPFHNENPINVEESTEILTTAMPEASVTSTEDISSTDFGEKYTHTEATTQQGIFPFTEDTSHVQASYTTDSELAVDDTATDKTQTEDITQVFTTSRQIAMADDAGIFQTENNTSHLVNFVDLDISLDLPDGIEGNVPVSVLPPVVTPSTTTGNTFNHSKKRTIRLSPKIMKCFKLLNIS
ncbi:hypothetical protein CDAR_6902 [Caerostris darwini]|uniref:TEP1-F n=1 Tax=Caerostris darwini TaxID=1538125 RepID=A0AAV4SCI5_9ARAC|nr:hypothetical protein CDAR_6902 [Caerostris darwini]